MTKKSIFDTQNIVAGIILLGVAALGTSFVTVQLLEDRFKAILTDVGTLKKSTNRLNLFVAQAHPKADTSSLIMASLEPVYRSVIAVEQYAHLTEGVDFKWGIKGPEVQVAMVGQGMWSQVLEDKYGNYNQPIFGRLTRTLSEDNYPPYVWQIFSSEGKLIMSAPPADITKAAQVALKLRDE